MKEGASTLAERSQKYIIYISHQSDSNLITV